MRMPSLIAVICCLAASLAHADIRHPDSLRRACIDRRAEVDGYVAGWTDKLLDDQYSALQIVEKQTDPAGQVPSMEIFFNVTANICLPQNLSVSEAADYICKRISEKHDFRGDRASGFLAYVLSEKYPCPK